MKKLFLSLALLPLLGLTLALQEPKERKRKERPETEISQRMERLEDAARVVRKSLKDPSTWPAALTALAEVQQLTLECKALTPAAAPSCPRPSAPPSVPRTAARWSTS